MLGLRVQTLVTYQVKTEKQRDCETPGGWEREKNVPTNDPDLKITS